MRSFTPRQTHRTDLSYTVNDELGTVSGQTFTAGSKAGRATITGSNGAVSGSMNVCITTGVDSIALQSGGKALSSISVKPGQSINVDALAYHLGHTMGAVISLRVSVRRCRCKCGRRVHRRQSDGLRHAHLLVWQRKQVHFGQCRHGRRAERLHTVADFESGLNNLTASDGVTLAG